MTTKDIVPLGTPGFLEATGCGLLCCGSQLPPSSGGSQSLSRGSLAPAHPHWAGGQAPGRGWRLLPWTGGTWVAARRRTWTHSTMTTRLSATGASSLLPWPSSWGSLSSSVKDSAVEAKRSTGKSMRMICNDRVSGAPRAGGPFGKPSRSW
ncbi:sodium/potassium-transporting ATPase subunit gamma isoform X2 [Canis lupus baileyi]|uniref:sodium/potassium-transporting ATPase subunit gamma isoform X2 n=1 Tax=Canis lupus baileyi TaxID=143281 RepID=UPI003B9719DC